MPIHQPSPYGKRRKKKEERYNYNEPFLSQNVRLSDYVFLPDGMEALFLIFYFVAIPYSVGLIVIWLFIAGGDLSNFLVLDIFTIIPVWSIGYETVAGLIMLNIITSAIQFNIRRRAYLAKQADSIKKQKKRNPSKYDIMKNYSQNR